MDAKRKADGQPEGIRKFFLPKFVMHVEDEAGVDEGAPGLVAPAADPAAERAATIRGAFAPPCVCCG